MTKKNEMHIFLKKIMDKKLMTKFLTNVFDYEGIEDFNYIARVGVIDNSVFIDVYDNVTVNRFNRYYFNFDSDSSSYFNQEYDSVYVTMISVLNTEEGEDKLLKLAYLFKLPKNKRIKYANTFLDKIFIDILNEF